MYSFILPERNELNKSCSALQGAQMKLII